MKNMKKCLCLVLALALVMMGSALAEAPQATPVISADAGFSVNSDLLTMLLSFTGTELDENGQQVLAAAVSMANNARVTVTMQPNGVTGAVTLNEKPLLNVTVRQDAGLQLDTSVMPAYTVDATGLLAMAQQLQDALSACTGTFAPCEQTLDGKPCVSAPFQMGQGMYGMLMGKVLSQVNAAAAGFGAANENLTKMAMGCQALSQRMGTADEAAAVTGTVLAAMDGSAQDFDLLINDGMGVFAKVHAVKSDAVLALDVLCAKEATDFDTLTPESDLFAGSISMNYQKSAAGMTLSVSAIDQDDIAAALNLSAMMTSQAGGDITGTLYVADTDNALVTISGKLALGAPELVTLPEGKTVLALDENADEITYGALALDLTGDGMAQLLDNAFAAMPQETQVLSMALNQMNAAQ